MKCYFYYFVSFWSAYRIGFKRNVEFFGKLQKPLNFLDICPRIQFAKQTFTLIKDLFPRKWITLQYTEVHCCAQYAIKAISGIFIDVVELAIEIALNISSLLTFFSIEIYHFNYK